MDPKWNEDVIWQAEIYHINSVEIELHGEKKVIKAWAGKWNGYYQYTGEDQKRREEREAVQAALAVEIEKRKAAGQKPDYLDREP
jgi:hypothetical protein